ncbi:MAG: hypothetical protein ABFC78_10100 [Methanoregula sp.]
MQNSETNEQDVITPGAIASGASYSNRINPCGTVSDESISVAGETTPSRIPDDDTGLQHAGATPSPRRRTVKSRKSGKACRRKGTAPNGRTAPPKENWQHAPRGTWEAANLLAAEGYVVGKTTGPAPVFDLVGRSPYQAILVKIVRPREPVTGAARVVNLYLPEILTLRPYYRSATDIIELWVFSKEAGLLRYRIFDWGIANTKTITKILKIPPAPAHVWQNVPRNPADQQTRNSPCPVSVSG